MKIIDTLAGSADRTIADLNLEGVTLCPGATVDLNIKFDSTSNSLVISLLLYENEATNPSYEVELNECVPITAIPKTALDLQLLLDPDSDADAVIEYTVEEILLPVTSVSVTKGFNKDEAEDEDRLMFELVIEAPDRMRFVTLGDCTISEANNVLLPV